MKEVPMSLKPHSLLRLYTDEAALYGDKRLFEVIMERAKEQSLLGASVFRGRVGYGHAPSHPRGFLDHNYPLVIEVVDEEQRLRSFVTSLSDLHGLGLATIERVEPLIGGRGVERLS